MVKGEGPRGTWGKQGGKKYVDVFITLIIVKLSDLVQNGSSFEQIEKFGLKLIQFFLEILDKRGQKHG